MNKINLNKLNKWNKLFPMYIIDENTANYFEQISSDAISGRMSSEEHAKMLNLKLSQLKFK